MSHKADASFFDNKKPWSRKKDQILDHYLKPYFAKIKDLKEPLYLIDAFAGPGRFRNGDDGSPLIFAKNAAPLADIGYPVTLLCIETVENLYEDLCQNLLPYSFADPRKGEFLSFISEISMKAQSHTTFLYVDPYAVKGLAWEQLERVIHNVSNSSVEVLLNFNAPIFVRWGWQLIKGESHPPGISYDELEEMDNEEFDSETPPIEKLNLIAGGEWWREVLEASTDFHRQCIGIVDGICRKLTNHFREVLYVAIKDGHKPVPKYYMVFATRSEHGLVLMNDRMLIATGEQELISNPLYGLATLKEKILEALKQWTRRDQLIKRVIRENFCKFLYKQIRSCITELRDSGQLETDSGRKRMNDDTLVRRTADAKNVRQQ